MIYESVICIKSALYLYLTANLGLSLFLIQELAIIKNNSNLKACIFYYMSNNFKKSSSIITVRKCRSAIIFCTIFN